MPQKNMNIFTIFKIKKMATVVLKKSLFMAVLCCVLLSTGSCKKLALAVASQSDIEKYFADNVLNRTFVVDFASNAGTDITSQYTGYNFVLTNTTSYYNGDMTGTKNGVTYSGTWSTNSDYSKLVINLTTPSVPTEFVFLNGDWRFTKKDPPLLKLAPYSSSDPKILYMRRL
jgi:hypothetical protein